MIAMEVECYDYNTTDHPYASLMLPFDKRVWQFATIPITRGGVRGVK